MNHAVSCSAFNSYYKSHGWALIFATVHDNRLLIYIYKRQFCTLVAYESSRRKQFNSMTKLVAAQINRDCGNTSRDCTSVTWRRKSFHLSNAYKEDTTQLLLKSHCGCCNCCDGADGCHGTAPFPYAYCCWLKEKHKNNAGVFKKALTQVTSQNYFRFERCTLIGGQDVTGKSVQLWAVSVRPCFIVNMSVHTWQTS